VPYTHIRRKVVDYSKDGPDFGTCQSRLGVSFVDRQACGGGVRSSVRTAGDDSDKC
jgi:hypothetical protein